MVNPYPQPDADYDDEPDASAPWLAMIAQAEKVFRDYHTRGDSIDKQYADAERLAGVARDREFQLFWANIQTLAPSIYARPPIPVVVPRFRDRNPLKRLSSELLERCTSVSFELAQIDSVMRALRDDLAVQGRGVPRVRLETDDGKRICIDHVPRRDFLHDPCRTWTECGWVAFPAWLTRKEFDKEFPRFKDRGAVVWDQHAREVGASNELEKIKVSEVWHKREKKVVWICEGVDEILDKSDPPLKLEGFFPCPRPAYGTVQRGSLVPIQDFLFVKDQLEEANKLTNRIQALADAIKVRGFYAGGSSAGDAIETAITLTDDRKVLIPVPNWAALAQGGGDPIIWLPIDMIAATIVQLVELRKQIIADIYEITGLSDIMRGSTDANETATAQQLKSQYGSVRVRDRQNELIRIARDIAAIVAEVLAEEFGKDALLEMSQMDFRTDADVAKQRREIEGQIRGIEAQAQSAMSDPQFMQQAQQNPEAAQQLQGQVQEQIGALQQQLAGLEQIVTIEEVMKLFHDQKTRPFVLDIETDSTIQPDEDAEKQRRNEFLTALAGTMQQLVPLVQQEPQAAPFAGEVLKFALGPYRVGRELEGAVDEFVEQIKQRSGQQQPNPEAEAAAQQMQAEQQRQQAKDQAEEARMQRDEQRKDAEAQRTAERDQFERGLKQQEAEVGVGLRQQESAAKLEQIREQRRDAQAKHAQDMERGALEIAKLDIGLKQAAVTALTPPEPPANPA